MNQFPKSCTIFSEDFSTIHSLHSKWEFIQKCETFNIPTLSTFRIYSQSDLENLPFDKPVILKPCYSRASQFIYKYIPGTKIPKLTYDPSNPWVAQEWVDGTKHCSFSTCHNGKITAHVTYPVIHALDNSSCLHFEAKSNPAIDAWIENFVKKQNFTGQIGFDFIQKEDGSLYCIECNPRGTSGILLLGQSGNLDKAIFNTNNTTLVPKEGTKEQIFLAMMIFFFKVIKKKTFFSYFKQLFTTKDGYFSSRDLGPLLSKPLIFSYYIFLSIKLRKNFQKMYTYDLDWDGDVDLEQGIEAKSST